MEGDVYFVALAEVGGIWLAEQSLGIAEVATINSLPELKL